MCRTSAVILIFVCLTSFCAQGQISGIVLDKNTNSPIEYATIILKQGDKILEGTISNPDGSFLLPISGNGNFNIEISFLGYQKLETENVDVKKNTPLDLAPNLKIINKVKHHFIFKFVHNYFLWKLPQKFSLVHKAKP